MDLLIIMIVLFTFALVIFLGYKILGSFNTEIQANSAITAEGKAGANYIYAKFNPVFDKLFLFLFVGMLIATLIGAWFIDVHPLFFIVSVIVLIFLLIGVVALSNIFIEMLANPELSMLSASFPIITFFMSNLLYISIASAILVMLALYAKPRYTTI